jgi:hypothetical protein
LISVSCAIFYNPFLDGKPRTNIVCRAKTAAVIMAEPGAAAETNECLIKG